jgi:hypothetical protein
MDRVEETKVISHHHNHIIFFYIYHHIRIHIRKVYIETSKSTYKIPICPLQF